jgi:hypothetical protein
LEAYIYDIRLKICQSGQQRIKEKGTRNKEKRKRKKEKGTYCETMGRADPPGPFAIVVVSMDERSNLKICIKSMKIYILYIYV